MIETPSVGTPAPEFVSWLLREVAPGLTASFLSYTPTPPSALGDTHTSIVLNHEDHHEVARTKEFRVDRVSPVLIRSMAEGRPDAAVGLNSLVGSRHIPMVDMACPASDGMLEILVEAAEEILHTGWILRSGNSYHVYGDILRDEHGWRRVLYRFLLLGRATDSVACGHRLLAGHSTLRLTACESKPAEPVVVASFGYSPR